MEVMVILLILSVAVLPLAGMLYSGQKMTVETRSADIALYLAQAKMEELKGYSFDNLVNINDKTAFSDCPHYFYTVNIERESDYLKKITVTVHYELMGKERKLMLTGVKAKR